MGPGNVRNCSHVPGNDLDLGYQVLEWGADEMERQVVGNRGIGEQENGGIVD